MRKIVTAIALAGLLAACGGAGSGGNAPRTTQAAPANTGVPAIAGTEAPKQYYPGRTASPSSSPEEYSGY